MTAVKAEGGWTYNLRTTKKVCFKPAKESSRPSWLTVDNR